MCTVLKHEVMSLSVYVYSSQTWSHESICLCVQFSNMKSWVYLFMCTVLNHEVMSLSVYVYSSQTWSHESICLCVQFSNMKSWVYLFMCTVLKHEVMSLSVYVYSSQSWSYESICLCVQFSNMKSWVYLFMCTVLKHEVMSLSVYVYSSQTWSALRSMAMGRSPKTFFFASCMSSNDWWDCILDRPLSCKWASCCTIISPSSWNWRSLSRRNYSPLPAID